MSAVLEFESKDVMTQYPDVEIVAARAIHVSMMKNNLRRADAVEVMGFGISVSRGLWLSYRHALVRKTAIINGKVAAMWGCNGDILGMTGQPWLLTSPDVYKISPLKFARIYQQEVYSMLDLFPVLVNYVDTDYTNAIRLLDIVGFEIGEPETMGTTSATLYRKFTLRRE